jgi:hypothetical protein
VFVCVQSLRLGFRDRVNEECFLLLLRSDLFKRLTVFSLDFLKEEKIADIFKYYIKNITEEGYSLDNLKEMIIIHTIVQF